MAFNSICLNQIRSCDDCTRNLFSQLKYHNKCVKAVRADLIIPYNLKYLQVYLICIENVISSSISANILLCVRIYSISANLVTSFLLLQITDEFVASIFNSFLLFFFFLFVFEETRYTLTHFVKSMTFPLDFN